MKLDILAFGAHPDDIELGAGGTLAKHARMGNRVGMADLTRGELGTRGTPEIRDGEAQDAARILGASVRINLGFRDGFFANDEQHQMEVIRVLRKYQPEIVICNAIDDRHPDHGRGSRLVSEACFYAGLRKVQTEMDGKLQEPWRPRAVYHYIQFRNLEPDLLVDISDVLDLKLASVKAHMSQFYNPDSTEPDTIISSPEFLANVTNRCADMGRFIGVKYAEAFTVERYPGVHSLMDLL